MGVGFLPSLRVPQSRRPEDTGDREWTVSWDVGIATGGVLDVSEVRSIATDAGRFTQMVIGGRA